MEAIRPSISRRSRNRRHRHELILTVASQLFASQGYEGTRIEEIAEASSVAPATVYNYFSTKANILTALAMRHARTSLPERRAYIRNPPQDPVKAVQGFENLLADQALRTLGRECWRVILATPYTQPGDRLHRAGIFFNWLIIKHYVKMLNGMRARGVIGEHVNISELATLITALGTHHFSLFISDETMTMEALKAGIGAHVQLIFTGVIGTASVSPDSRRTRPAT
jgi:Transcriptional regulator